MYESNAIVCWALEEYPNTNACGNAHCVKTNCLDELKYTQTRIVAIQTDQFAPCAQMAGNANLQLGPYNCMKEEV
jgi:hypothetical protein